MTPFGGFDMPIQYKGIIDEHQAVRTDVGVFDVSHMGEVRITGADAMRYVNHIFTNDIATMADGGIQYGMMLYPDGGTVDDLLVYRNAADDYFLVINAANIDKDVAWINGQSNGFNVNIDHQSDRYGQIALQGPNAEATLRDVLGIDAAANLTFYTFTTLDRDGDTVIVSRTGYTGEDGFEIYGSHATIQNMWDKLIEAGVQPCGLGCRDTLRFEVGLPLYGDELSEKISPIMAGLGLFVKLDKEEFIGKEACAEQKANGVTRKLVGLELEGRAIPRHGYPVLAGDEVVGEVTTGYHGISVDKSIAMALVDTQYAALDTPLMVQIRKKTFPAVVVKKKFYKKSYKK